MTTISQAREAIYGRFNTNWGTTSPFQFDNENFTPPDKAWARLVVRHIGSSQETLGSSGNRKFERRAVVFIQIFTKADKGTSEADTLVRIARDIFEGINFSGLRFLHGVIRETPEPQDSKWYQVVVEIFFAYDETK